MNYKTILATAIDEIINLGQDYIERLIEIPKEKEFGDYSFPCYKVINKIGKSPVLIAKEIKEEFRNEFFEKVEICGSYLNFYINKNRLMNSIIDNILLEGELYGASNKGKGKKVYIKQFFSKSTKGFKGNYFFSGIIKNSLCNIFKSQGYEVNSEEFLDHCKSSASDCYNENGDNSMESLDEVKNDLLNKRTDEVAEEIVKRKDVKNINCVKVIDLRDYNMAPFIIKNISNELSLEAIMLSRLIYEKEIRSFDKCVIIGRKDDNIYFNQLCKVLDIIKMEWEEVSLEYISLGIVKFENEYIFNEEDSCINIEDIIKKVYKDLELTYENRIDYRSLKGSMIFSCMKDFREKNKVIFWNNIMNFNCESYLYVEETYIRGIKVLRESKQIDFSTQIPNSIDMYSRELIEIVGEFNKEILHALDLLEPYIIVRYVIDLAKAFNKFYSFNVSSEGERVLCEPYVIKVIKASTIVLKNAMKFIGVQTIEEI